ncbi:MAG: glycosyltransferase family 39 protein [Planctomycetes bacterium]|nr:glycosyltransferase family 39 protein [Planctomycetota bacterium]
MTSRVRQFVERNRDALLVAWLGALFLMPFAATGWFRNDAIHYAAVIKSTLASGDWLTLRFGTEPYFNKPPLFFWVGCATFAVLGATPFAAHVLGAGSGIGLLLAVRSLGARLLDAPRGIVAAIVLGTGTVFLHNTGVPRLEAPLALCSVGAFVAVLAGEGDRRKYAWFGVAVGCGVAIKGPPGLYPLAILAVWSLLRRKLAPWNDRWFWLGMPAVVLFIAPWLVANHLRFGDVFTKAYFVDDLQATATGERVSHNPFLKYGHDLLTDWWPWIPFVVHGAWRAIRRVVRGERDDLATLSIAWIVVVAITILDLGRAYTRYVYPLLPATSILAAESIVAIWPRVAGPSLRNALFGSLLVGTLLVTFGPIDPHGGEIPDAVLFEPCLRTQHALEPILFVGQRVPKRFQAAAIFHCDTIVDAIPVKVLRERVLRDGRVVCVAPRDLPSWPDDLSRRVLVAGESDDLVEVTPAAITLTGK